MIQVAYFLAVFLFLAALLSLLGFDEEHGSIWAEYLLSFGISFASAYDYHRRHTEKKTTWDLLSPSAAKVGACAGVLGLAIFAVFVRLFGFEANRDFILFFLLGYCFFSIFGMFVSFCVAMARK